ncbi:MAG: hypothetical protein LKF49_09135 [Bifidobacterium tibiigranuli]|uniref:hypothetical protein n=2 Tax=Bifidobacterium tibiigranuli TaxID=2172043 RepID=UPI00235794CA|nr:hypothetical protein [Bifidobacterium tibiigranuli]MCH4204351.1 hypothetical protein [Bifidobacterium tibiigranuli]MCH4275398.1 hypothetical protein [Bifidobacterium tibiigranuli]MCI1791603.1 hypothetical protein [Bifidobacterium tibiigranuli]
MSKGISMNFRSWIVWALAAVGTALTGFITWSALDEVSSDVIRETGANAQESLIARLVISGGAALLFGVVILLVAAAISGAIARSRRHKHLSV